MSEQKPPQPPNLIGICAGCLLLLFLIVTGIAQLNINHADTLRSDAKLSEIQQEISDKDYRSALENLNQLKEYTGYKSKKISSETEDMTKEIEFKLYNECESEKYEVSLCELYSEFYPNGKYIDEIKQKLDAAPDR